MSSTSKMIMIGGLVGAALGATAAWAYGKAQEGKLPPGSTAATLRLKAGAPDYVKIGVALVALIRQVVELFKPV